MRLKAGSEGVRPGAKGLELSVAPRTPGFAPLSASDPAHPATGESHRPISVQFSQSVSSVSSVQFSSVQSVQSKSPGSSSRLFGEFRSDNRFFHKGRRI